MTTPPAIQILLVEDNLGDARLVREALRDTDANGTPATFHLLVAERLETALEVLGREHVNVVLLDLSLPDSDGYATVETLLAAAPEHCAVVVLTRADDTSLGARAVRDGAQDYLTKAQFDHGSLSRTLRYARDRKQGEVDRLELARAEVVRREEDAHRATLQALFDNAQDAMLISDDDGRYLNVNRAALGLLQRSREELLTMAVADLAPRHPEETRQAWSRFLRDGEQSGELTVERPDGTSRVVEYVAKARIQPGQHMSVMRDITERKNGEAERARLLELAQFERQRALEANRAQDEFLSVVSHELRSPLTAILGWTQMIRTEAMTVEKVTRALETIERNANVQAKLIDDILDTARITTGKLRLELESADIGTLAEAAVDVVRPAAYAKGVRLNVRLDPGLGEAQVDGARLQQIIWNLLANAVKFTPSGGRVELEAKRDGEFIEIAITDTGMGMAPEFLPRMFDPFRQADATITRSSGGLGLGLSIVKHLVELHGGSVRAESAGSGHGSVLTVRLPVSSSEPGAESVRVSARRTSACPPELAGLIVLVLDDETDSRELLGELLEQAGMHVVLASSVVAGVMAFSMQRPDLVICDIAMPVEDGYGFIARIRKLAPRDGGNVPVIALTAYSRFEDKAHALRAGFTRHVGKPVNAEELFAAIGAASGRRREMAASASQ